MKALRCLLILYFFIGFQSCYKEEVIYNSESNPQLELHTILRINEKDCFFDNIGNNLRFPIDNEIVKDFSPLIEFQEYSNVYYEGKLLQNNNINNLGDVEINREYEIVIVTSNETRKLSLSFTNLPVIQLITPNKVFDEPKTAAKIIINYPEAGKKTDKYFIGLEYRGGTSQSHQKKSYGFSLKGSINLDDDISNSFFDMKNNNDWILDAMWIDKARLRNKTSFELWNGINRDKNYGTSAKFIELYLNNEHQGLYCFGENINPEFLNLNKENAVLYKATEWEDGATRFETYTNNSPLNYYWDGWEQKYPDPKLNINWLSLDELRKLTVTGNDKDFSSQITSLIDIDNFVDYFIFLNIISAMDNTGKNTFLGKESINEKFYIIPWDLDGSWGLFWDGTHAGYTSVLSNSLYDRLIETNTDNFKSKLKQRWSSLRENLFSDKELKKMFIENFTLINKSGIIDKENRKWGCNIELNLEQEYLINWLEKRTDFLDCYFDNL